MVVYESIYQGSNYSLDSKYNLSVDSEYSSPASSFALALDPRTANQLKETSDKLNTGAKMIEFQGTFSKTLESIPEQHLEETKRQAKLVGAKITFHGPMEEPSGFSSQGGRSEWNEENRKHIERQFNQAMERAHKLDPDGNIVVTLHSTAQLPEMLEREKTKKGQEVKGMWVINSRTGQVGALKDQQRYFPQEKDQKKYVFDPESELKRINRDNWINELDQAVHRFSMAEDREIRLAKSQIRQSTIDIFDKIQSGNISPGELAKINNDPNLREQLQNLEDIKRSEEVFLRSSYNDIKKLYDDSYHNSSESDRKKLDEFKNFVNKNWDHVESRKPNLSILKKVIEKGLDTFNKIEAEPKFFEPMQDFIIKKSSDTFSNVAFDTYKKFGKNSPIISIENPPAGQGLSRAEDIKELVEKSRGKLITKLKNNGYSKSESEKIAEKMLGVTWDVGHINMIRKFGYEKEDLLKEAKIIKPYLKHIHLSDNFGFEHTELPMGMGNVPLKETAKVFGDKFKKISKAVETGDWYQHFQVSPFKAELEAFGSPVGTDFDQTWNQVAWSYAPYYAGYGTVNPEIHHSIYGRGFVALPQELGGQIPGQQNSRATGTPLA